jgi:hypothetical protein
MTTDLILVRGMSHIVVCLVVRPRRANHSTGLWQDKSRKLRHGRVAEEQRGIKQLTRGATTPHSLPICLTHWDFRTARTSRAPTP